MPLGLCERPARWYAAAAFVLNSPRGGDTALAKVLAVVVVGGGLLSLAPSLSPPPPLAASSAVSPAGQHATTMMSVQLCNGTERVFEGI